MLMITVAKFLLALASLQESAPQTPGPLMWTGEMRSTDETFDGIPLIHIATAAERAKPEYQTLLLFQLNTLVANAEVQRNFSQVIILLDVLRAQACWSSAYPGKAKVVAEIAQTRADWLEKLGRHPEAVYAAHHPLVQPDEKDKAPYDRFTWVASNGSLAQLANDIDALPQMVVLHKRFPSDAPATKGGDAIEEAVRKEILEGDPKNLKNFGARCVPALKKVLLEQPEQLSSRLPIGSDPLFILLTIDRNSGIEFVLSTLGKRGPIWSMRVIECLRAQLITIQNGWTTSPDPYAPPTFNDPLIQRVVDALASQAMSSGGYFELLAPLIGNDIVSAATQEYLLKQTQATDPAILKPLVDMLDGLRVGPHKRALCEAFLDASDSALRQRCANALLRYPAGPATLRAAEHSDPNVRMVAAQALVRHRSAAFNYQRNQANDPRDLRWYEVPRTPEIAAALLRLAKDPERSVRTQLVRALQESKEPPPPEVLDALLADADSEVRQVAAYDWGFDPKLQARVLEQLAADADPTVLQAVGFGLNMCLNLFRKGEMDGSTVYLPALAKWLMNPATSVVRDANRGPGGPISVALTTAEGARIVLDICTRGPHQAELTLELIRAVEWRRGQPKDRVIFDSLDASGVAEVFALYCEHAEGNMVDGAERSVSEAVSTGQLDVKPFLDLARAESRSRELRVRALVIASPKAGPELEPIVRSILASATPAELSPNDDACRGLVNRLNEICRRWSEAREATAAWCADPKIPDGIALALASYARATPAFDAPLTRACLQRWARLDEGWQRWAANALYYLDPRVDVGVLELWRAQYKNAKLSETIASAMARYPIDESVPLLADLAVARVSDGSSTAAIGALTTRLDDLGADALLKAIAAAPYESIRKQCFDGLEQIRKYQDEKQSWQKRKGGDAAREQAITDLLPMLSDKEANIRAAAARSLATLQAAEHLPKLVALLKDKDASVREAAQKALDALNGAGAKKP